MNKKIEKISTFLKVEEIKKDKRVVPFLICILIATAAWFFNALGKEYSTTIIRPVKYINAPKHRFLSNTPPSNLTLKVEAHGFALLRYKLNLFSSPVTLNLKQIAQHQIPENGIYTLETNTLLPNISEQISNEINVTEVLPSEIKLFMDSLRTKVIKIKPQLTLDFMPQFSMSSPTTVNPESVEITGPATIIDTIQYLYTKRQTFHSLDETMVSSVDLCAPQGTTVSPNEVKLQINVEKFTEKEINVPVEIKNQPPNVNIKLFPSEIKLDCMVGLSKFENLSATDFSIIIDFDKIKDNTSKLPVQVSQQPSFVKIMRFSPEAVEYLIETN
jgi:hypothetical protein